jgi:putative transcriptional regulator
MVREIWGLIYQDYLSENYTFCWCFFWGEGHHLSRILGEKKLKISQVAQDTGINRGTLTRLYKETAVRVELDVIEKLCRYLEVDICDLFEIIDD